ncbi:hypothetical protein MPNT_300017 [Candidatus Methylacidithermus pantelleriae]|uniref:Uncharacterized protein n=1 Tax=Candidatus Methylacidithermus pantelleriae TaxID=2744239 RepID=A0A8J2BLL1_9BACT|nr:hypothetical protein MPNT_300017 [Candidatus Methylacidithermus pantelleriae]
MDAKLYPALAAPRFAGISGREWCGFSFAYAVMKLGTWVGEHQEKVGRYA